MDRALLNKLLFAQLRHGREAEISVTGVSMNPTLWEGDTVTVAGADEYAVGDILVFLYKGELLIHRLLKIEEGRYFCKGDNAFRLEDLPAEDIAGRVILHNKAPLAPTPSWLPVLSYRVNRVFRQCRYDIQKAKESGVYRFYKKILWKKEDDTMIYKKNEAMDYIFSDETSLAVFDPESGDTHFFDETAIDILNCLNDPCDLPTLLARLCEIYEATPEDIKADVEEFLAEVVAKRVVLAE
ncbi:MAG: HPr-rel-A system PqqD family peptide chaperone [Clostridia bacterium]|nr:HPr-rel-A system PqqD family peptide chaperone [Clostridia bacterium]